VLEALSQLSIWAGRYLMARTRRESSATSRIRMSFEITGSRILSLKMFFERAPKELESKLPQPIGSRFESLVVTRQPGLQRRRQWERC
jgi:hypothetical protein